MARIFQSFRIGSLEIPNRLVRSATNMRLAGPSGEVTKDLIEVYRNLAKGGAGLIITGHAYVTPQGKVGPGQLGIWSDELIPGLRALSEVVHEHGARIVAQLAHGGPLAYAAVGERVAPSPMKGARPLKEREIEDLVKVFLQAALRAKEAGFDGVQLHAAHGYLLSSFLSPKANRRRDHFGGREGGIRLLGWIIEEVKHYLGEHFPVFVKLGPDSSKDGNTEQDVASIAWELAKKGLDAVEVSRGISPTEEIIRPKVTPGDGEVYNLPCALEVKRRSEGLRVIVVGGIRSFEKAEEVLELGIEAVALSRPLIAEPDLPKRWRRGDLRPSKCRSCNLCFDIKEPVRCRAS